MKVSTQDVLSNRYFCDPLGFIHHILPWPTWPALDSAVDSVARNRLTSVATCAFGGDDIIAASLFLWWELTRGPGKVIAVAPTARLAYVLQVTIRKMGRLALDGPRANLPAVLSQANSRAQLAGQFPAPDTLAIGFAAERLDHVTVDLLEAVTSAQGGRVLLVGNPLSTEGPFFDSHMDARERRRWSRHCIDALETPNYTTGRPVFPGVVSKEWVEGRLREWEPNSEERQRRIHGRFVAESDVMA